MSGSFSRRDLLKRASLLGAAVVVAPLPGEAEPSLPAVPPVAVPPVLMREPLETLTAAEAEILEAAVARIIPTDANGPGATEARAAHYIDHALSGFLAPSRATYTAGLAALDAYARTAKGSPFAQLALADQDAVLTVLEKGDVPGFQSSSAEFFGLLREHTIQGTFCDPVYGGNANFVGWDLIGYPGVRTMVTAAQQKMGTPVQPNHKSAYDYAQFAKTSAKAADHEDSSNGGTSNGHAS